MNILYLRGKAMDSTTARAARWAPTPGERSLPANFIRARSVCYFLA